MTPFVILALPRSRTWWLSRFLSGNSGWCGHDLGIECGSIAEFEEKLSRLKGTVETGAAFAWPLLAKKTRVFVVRRGTKSVNQSLQRIGLKGLEREIETRARDLDNASEHPGVVTIRYAALNDEQVCAWLFEQCLGVPHDHGWWAAMSVINLQINLPARLRQLEAKRPRIEALKAEARALINA